MEPKARLIAAEMLDVPVEELPDSLVYLLDKADALVHKAGGGIASRQVVATIIVMNEIMP